MSRPTQNGGWSRRNFLATTAAGTMSASLLDRASAQSAAQAAPERGAVVPLNLKVNGQEHRFGDDVRTTLLDALREHLGFTGS